MENMFKASWQHHKSLLILALPMILSNISTPLLGLVDTAVIGHLSESVFLAGVAIGSMLISLIYWLAGFLRMATTGLVAAACGADDEMRQMTLLKQGLVFALMLGLALLALSPFISWLIHQYFSGSEQALGYAQTYVSIRLYSAPAALMNLVLLGYMLGMGNSRGPFYLVLVTNVFNILLDLLLVVYLDWQVEGVAWASCIAEYLAFIFGCYWVKKIAEQHGYSLYQVLKQKVAGFKPLMRANSDIFIRSLFLQFCFAFMTYYGGILGDTVLAANAVLLNFLLLVSFAIDGVAYATEAKVGQAKGANNTALQHLWVSLSLFWGCIFSLIYCFGFFVFGEHVINLLTDIELVRITANDYLFWLYFLPVLAVASFVFDGVFIGLMNTKAMRNSMIFSAVAGFFTVFIILKPMGNHALWAAMSSFMLLRGVSLGLIYWRQYYRGR
ncbi:MATE family efflux transporter [Pseudoalteromonas tunicata]|uniref:MATE family efflux transporter n=1 Tax=Pseudoalteromonas tunicata TaxID=314281 RepID=UPI00273E4589|nr:MATE family efflux transporter [Pseudoalteromonas tunicata]MDP5213247.1 MATE family efflux transporter [Pseudoalteromonas tunicata]